MLEGAEFDRCPMHQQARRHATACLRHDAPDAEKIREAGNAGAVFAPPAPGNETFV
jgi:hypothetical protein